MTTLFRNFWRIVRSPLYQKQNSLLLPKNCLFTTPASLGVRLPPKDADKKKKKNPLVVAELKNDTTTEFHELPIVLIKATFNNTLVYLTDHKGTMATWTSAGIEGFNNAKRGTNYAGKVAGESMAKRATNLGVNRIRLKLKGMGPGRQDAVKGLIASGMDIVSITDVTPTPHNGPKPKKQRRL